MNYDYQNYLESDAWQFKRLQRLSISHFRCAACSKKEAIHVHHLTYERIYKEDMEDLLPLCEHHHQVAEALYKEKKLPKVGNVLFLATETIRLILECEKKKDAVETVVCEKAIHPIKTNNIFQDNLICAPWFVNALKEPDRNIFKRIVRMKIWGCKDYYYVWANAITLYDRNKKDLQCNLCSTVTKLN